jgi:hypothetical protein
VGAGLASEHVSHWLFPHGRVRAESVSESAVTRLTVESRAIRKLSGQPSKPKNACADFLVKAIVKIFILEFLVLCRFVARRLIYFICNTLLLHLVKLIKKLLSRSKHMRLFLSYIEQLRKSEERFFVAFEDPVRKDMVYVYSSLLKVTSYQNRSMTVQSFEAGWLMDESCRYSLSGSAYVAVSES